MIARCAGGDSPEAEAGVEIADDSVLVRGDEFAQKGARAGELHHPGANRLVDRPVEHAAAHDPAVDAQSIALGHEDDRPNHALRSEDILVREDADRGALLTQRVEVVFCVSPRGEVELV